ncbi:MAG: hypothetical protein ACI83I_002648, partial [Bacteroidia bacterium]
PRWPVADPNAALHYFLSLSCFVLLAKRLKTGVWGHRRFARGECLDPDQSVCPGKP